MKRNDITRRDALAMLGAAGLAAVGGCPVDSTDDTNQNSTSNTNSTSNANGSANTNNSGDVSCVLTPEQTEGPYFVDELHNRADIRSNPGSSAVEAGTLLTLKLVVSDVNAGVCTPIEGATVDIWHCNADGEYSDVAQNGTSGQKFLRGYQVTDANGEVVFTTIVPGWYSGRTPHIHFKVRVDSLEFNSQLYFDEALLATIYAQAPYAARGTQDTTNGEDNIFDDATLLALTRDGDGYSATFRVGVNLP